MGYKFVQLLNSSSKSMKVDGSGTAKSFSYTTSQDGEKIVALTVTLKDEGTTDLNKFGAITALTNGVLVRRTIGGTTETIATIKDNSELSNVFSEYQHFGNSAVLSILGVVTAQGFGNSNNVFKGKLVFPKPLGLNNGDAVDMLVQDNLTNIDLLEAIVIMETP